VGVNSAKTEKTKIKNFAILALPKVIQINVSKIYLCILKWQNVNTWYMYRKGYKGKQHCRPTGKLESNRHKLILESHVILYVF